MEQSNNRIQFFRQALNICAKFGRSPESTFTIRGQAVSLRQVLKTLGAGTRLPRITESEARMLAGETEHFTYKEILTGLSARRTARRPTRARRSQRAIR